jgi:hypothetical protein
MWRRHREPPSRRPHPDPAVETELQRIISLQRAAARKEDEMDQLQGNINMLNTAMRRDPGAFDSNNDRRKQLSLHKSRISELEADVFRIHDEIASRLRPISEDDRAYLYDSTEQRG